MSEPVPPQIVEGDYVHVIDHEGNVLYRGIVRSRPGGPGDAWHIETTDEVVYVQTYGSICKKKVQL